MSRRHGYHTQSKSCHPRTKITCTSSPARRSPLSWSCDKVLYLPLPARYSAETPPTHSPCSRTQYGGKEVVFVGVSHPLVWAATRPKPEALFPSFTTSREWAAGAAAGAEEEGGVRSTPRASFGWPGGAQRASGVGDAGLGAGGSEMGSAPSSPRPGSGRSVGLGLGGGSAVEVATFTSEDVTRRWARAGKVCTARGKGTGIAAGGGRTGSLCLKLGGR